MRKRKSPVMQIVMIVLVAFFALAWTASAAPAKQTVQAAQPTAVQQPVGGITTPVPIEKVDCVVQGSPVEFPDDLYIKNGGNTVLTKGTKISWSVPNTTRKGTHTLAADLAPGKGTMASGVLAGGVPAGVICSCKVWTMAQVSTTPAGGAVMQPVKPILLSTLNCEVRGTPVEFPDDVYIQNKGTTAIAKGKVIHWAIPNTTREGNHTLSEDLAAGKGLMLNAVLPGGVPAGVQCKATVK